jgi:Na+-driven multidrug efflux pump
MRKYVAAALIGLALIGTQAAAADSLAMSAGDRLGDNVGQQNDLRGVPVYALIYGAAFAGLMGWALSDHGGAPASP